MEADTIMSIRNRMVFLEKNLNHLTIDADTHITNLDSIPVELKQRMNKNPNYFHGRPIGHIELLSEMELAEVDMCLIWQNPAATVYGSDKKKNFETLLAANKYIYDSAIQYPTKFIPAGWTDPKALTMEDALKLVDIFVNEFGFPFVKMNPAQNSYPINSDEVKIIQDKIVSLGAIPAFHYGADTPYTPPSGLAEIAGRYPEHPVLAVHMGGGGAGYVEAEQIYEQTRKLGLKYPNIKFILSARRDTHTESDIITYQLAGEPYSKNLFCASDAPYGRISWNFGGYRAMFETLMNAPYHNDPRLNQNPILFSSDICQNYLGGNFAALTLFAYQNILTKLRD